MHEYRIKVELPPVQARPTTVTVTCGESEMDMRQVQEDGNFSNRYAKIGEWLPEREWREPVLNKNEGFAAAPSLPYDLMLALVKEQVQTYETRRLVREHINAIEYPKD